MLLLQHLDQGDGPLIIGIRALCQSGNPGAAPRPQNQIPGHLPRCGTLQPEPPGQGQRPALDLPDVAGPGSLGGTLLGLAPSHRAGALGTLPPATRTPPQKAHRLGPADDPATPLMVSLANHAGYRSTPWCVKGGEKMYRVGGSTGVFGLS